MMLSLFAFLKCHKTLNIHPFSSCQDSRPFGISLVGC